MEISGKKEIPLHTWGILKGGARLVRSIVFFSILACKSRESTHVGLLLMSLLRLMRWNKPFQSAERAHKWFMEGERGDRPGRLTCPCSLGALKTCYYWARRTQHTYIPTHKPVREKILHFLPWVQSIPHKKWSLWVCFFRLFEHAIPGLSCALQVVLNPNKQLCMRL